MRKQLILLVFLFGIISNALAQERYISLSGGYTNPTGDFSKSDLNNLTAGYALSGYNGGFELFYFLNEYFGFGVNLRFNSCKPDVDYLNNMLWEKFGSQMESIKLTASNYNLHNFLIGPVLKTNIGDYLAIYGRVFAGVMSTYKPVQTLKYTPIYGEQVIKETIGDYTGSFAYNIGAGVIVKFSDKIGLDISADYIAGKPSLEKYDFESLEIVEIMQPISYFNLNLGLILSL